MLLQNDVLAEFGELVASGRCNSYKGPLFAGVDLGTANTVLAVVDSDGHPVAGATARSKGVRDGIVVDYIGTVQAVSRMKAALEEKLGVELSALPAAEAAAIHPAVTPDALAALTVEASVASRVSYGGTAPERVRQAIAAARAALEGQD